MKSFITKYSGLKYLAFLASFMLACTIVLAENDANDVKGKEVLTTLEQRMQKRISVDFRGLPMEDVLRAVAGQAEMDIIISPNVSGSVTVKLTNVPLEEALNNILAAHGYGYVAGKNMIRVAPIKELTEKSEMLVSRIYRITYADVKDVEEALKKFISKQGSLSYNQGTSNIIVTDTESKIKAIDTFISEIDRITPQIQVEARIYDITSKDKLDLGVEWSAGRNTTYGTSGVTDGRSDPFITGGFSGATGKTASVSGALRLGWLNDSIDVDTLLKAQQNVINAKLLANPRVLVLDNAKATFKIISEIPYQELSETSGGGTIGTTQFREVGVELEVTPHLTRDEMIRLQLKPKFSVKTDEVVIVGTSSNQFPQPVVDRREADTTLLVKNGQTVVLGGLRKKEVAQQVNKIPLLGDLPLIGMLFKFEGENTVTSELVVFVTPRIIQKPVMSETELKQYEVTEFNEPPITYTRAETGK